MRLIVVGITDLIDLEMYVYRSFASLSHLLIGDVKTVRLEIYSKQWSDSFSLYVSRELGHNDKWANIAEDKEIGTLIRCPEGVNLETTLSFFAYRFGQLLAPAGWILREQVSPAAGKGFVLDRAL